MTMVEFKLETDAAPCGASYWPDSDPSNIKTLVFNNGVCKEPMEPDLYVIFWIFYGAGSTLKLTASAGGAVLKVFTDEMKHGNTCERDTGWLLVP